MGGQCTAARTETDYLSPAFLYIMYDAHCGHMVNAGVKAALVQYYYSPPSCILIQLFHCRTYVRSCDHVLAVLDTQNGYLDVMDEGQQTDYEICTGNKTLQFILVGNVQFQGYTAWMTVYERFSFSNGPTGYFHLYVTMIQKISNKRS